MNVAGSLTFNSGSTAGASSGTERMRIDSSGRLNMMSSAGASPILYHGNDLTSTSPTTNLSFGNEQNGALLIYTNSSERMRIDASGNLLVGKTSASSASIGFQAGQDGFTAITRASAQPRSEEHTSELQSQSTISYAVFCLKKKKKKNKYHTT